MWRVKVQLPLLSLLVVMLDASLRSPLSLLYFNVGIPNLFNLSSWLRCLTNSTNLVTRLWTYSAPTNSLVLHMARYKFFLLTYLLTLIWGFQCELAYSNWDLTIALYNRQNTSIDMHLKFLLIIPSLAYALLTFSRKCQPNFNCWSTITSKSVIESALN